MSFLFARSLVTLRLKGTKNPATVSVKSRGTNLVRQLSGYSSQVNSFKNVATRYLQKIHISTTSTPRGLLQKHSHIHYVINLIRTNLTKSRKSQHTLLSNLALISGVGVCFVRGTWLTVECKSKSHKGSRLVGLDESYSKEDVEFDWKQFLELLWMDIGSISLAIFCALVAALVNIKLPLMVGDVVNVVSSFTKENAGNFIEEIRKPAMKLIGTYLLQGGVTFMYISLLSNVGENLASRLRVRLFDSLLKQDTEFFDRHKTGELIDRLTSDVQDLKSSFKMSISQGLRALTQTIGCVGALWIISPKLTGVMCAVIPVIIGIGTYMGGGLRKLSKAAQAQVAKATAVADEALSNVRTVKAFAMEKKEHELYSQEVKEAQRLNVRLGVGIGLFQGLANIALNGIVLGSLFIGGLFMSRQEITAGDLMSFLVATQTVERSLAQMSLLFGQVVRGLSAGSRIFEFINHESTIPLTGGDSIPYHCFLGDFEFRNVSFTYPTRPEQTVLENFSLQIPGGKKVALVGSSGAGKSTIASLLERFYDIQSGQITIDGEELQKFDPSWLRGRAIGYISQEPVLFATSIMENIRYGRPQATDTEVIEAAKAANAHDFITSFPNGYSTVLGERGVTVSGGQKQRIAIARAVIKNPSLLILDEATSALDAESERIVQETLNQISRGKTVLVIAHRLSTIRDADVIAVMSNGKIVEIGNHNSLKKKKGLYWELIKQQELEEEIKYFGLKS